MPLITSLVIGAAALYAVYAFTTSKDETQSPPNQPPNNQEEQQNEAIRRAAFIRKREALKRDALWIEQQRKEAIRKAEISRELIRREEERRLEERRQRQEAIRKAEISRELLRRDEERRLEELSQRQARHRAQAAARKNAAAAIAARRTRAWASTTVVSERSLVPPSPDYQQTWPLPSQLPSGIQSTRPFPQTSSNDQEAYQGPTERQPVSLPLPGLRRVSVTEQDKDINIVKYTGHDLRIEARKERDAMIECKNKATAARLRKATVDAKIYSNQEQRHRSEMQRLNGEASELIYAENNRRLKTGLIDLHGLYVNEAIQRTAEAVQAAVDRGDLEIKIIVGKGNNSTGLVPKLKPAVGKWLSLHQYSAKLDADGGRFVVDLQSRGDQEGSSDELSDISSGSEDSCDDYL